MRNVYVLLCLLAIGALAATPPPVFTASELRADN